LSVRTFVFDLDGVVYRGNDPIPGAVATIKNLGQLGHQVYFFTNNATKSRTSFVEKLRKMNVITDEDHVMTSAYATALYLRDIGAVGKTSIP
jgi:ribonucleotide monophosphatase NagD (HAD superfamily)